MIWNSLNDFHKNISEFEKNMAYKTQLEEFYKNVNGFRLRGAVLNYVSQLRSQYRFERQFEYKSFIISLYGYLELFIESVIAEYIDEIKKLLSSYNDLDTKTRDHYRKEMLAMYNRRKTPKIAHLTDGFISENLYKTLQKGAMEIMPEAFYQSGGNYNFGEISQSFKALGITEFVNEIKLYDPLKSYFNSLHYPANASSEVLFQKLDDLVVRRNEIAHGYNKENRLSNTVILQYKDFIKVFCETVIALLTDDLLRKKWNTLEYEAECSHMYQNNKVRIKGDFLVFEDMDVIQYRQGARPGYTENHIISLSVNGTMVSEHLSEENSGDNIVVQMEKAAARKALLRFN